MLEFFLRPLVSFALLSLLAVPAWGQNPNVTVDDQPTAEQKLEEVLELRKANRHAEAAELIQELIVSSRFKLVALGDGVFSDAGQWASDVLMRDGALRQAYRERYGAASDRLLEQARASEQPLTSLLEVYRLHAATPSGLEAALDAAGLLLESGEAQSAETLVAGLVRHPDRQAVLKRLQMLRGSAAAFTQNKVVLEEVVEALSELDESEAARLAQLAEAIEPATIVASAVQVDMGPKPISVRAPLWDQVLATSDNAQRWLQDDGAVLPMVTPSFVILNNGRQVVAMDRASGQRAWVYPPDEDTSVKKIITAQRWRDPRGVARGRGKVVAVLGECHGITERRNPYVPPNHLACVDEQTGKVLWERTAGEFREDEPTLAADRKAGRLNLQLTHFVGTPVLSQGTLFAILRRANSEGDTQSSWLLAYDAASGSLLWYRHLALVSLSYTNADSMRVSPHLTLHGDTLYFSDSLGSIGAIDRHTGGYRWLRVLPIGSQNTKSIVANTRGVTSAPVPTSAGLLVPLSLSSDRLMLVDPEDGSVLRSFKEDPRLSKTQYILETSRGVLAVSQTAVSYWDEDKAAVAWTFAFGNGETPRGRGDVSLRFAVLPTSQRLLVLDLATGGLLDEAPAVEGSVVVRDGEVLATSEGRLHAFTSWERVYKRLVDQVENRPEDPSAGLSLASIAMRQKDQNDSVLQGVGHALAAVARQSPRRKAAVASHVFEQLRSLIPKAEDAELRHELYKRLALVTQTAEQEAAYHLDAGLYFAQTGSTRLAIDHLHAVIAEPVFAASSYDIDGLVRPAGAVARQQIQQMIERLGRGVYARQDALAQARINELKAAGSLNASALAAVAKRYPLSPAAGQLLIEAADVRFTEGRMIAAASLYKQAMQRSVDQNQRQRAAGRLLQFYLDTGRPGFATTFVARLTAQHPGIAPIAEGQPLSLDDWQKRIAASPEKEAEFAELASAFDPPLLIAGRLIPRAKQTSHVSSGVYLLHGNASITWLDPDDPGKPRWRTAAPIGNEQVVLLNDQGEQALFWAAESGVVFALDRLTGEQLWQSTVTFGTQDEPRAPGLGENGVLDRVLVEVSETVLCFAHRSSAEVIAIDRASGAMLWQTTLEMTALTAIAVDDWSLAVVGRAGHPQQMRSGKLALLSLDDARPLLPQSQLRIALTPFGVELDRGNVIVLGSSGVMMFNAATGNAIWTQRISEKMLTGVYTTARQRIAVETNTGEVYVFDASDQGKQLRSLSVRGGGDRLPTQLLTTEDQIWCVSTRGVYRLGSSAESDWSHHSPLPTTSLKGIVIGKDHAAVIARPENAVLKNGIRLDVLESSGGRLVEQYNLGPLPAVPLPEQAAHWGSGLAIPAGDQTMLIPPAKPGD